ncbi:cupin domain protein [Mariprofundus micogutta]|uniref:Cupin domain protein n=1 Tax=Mariprofundus micogutta TaxID=1921010 RepID=A0A1L8CJU0_9PROT|nr:cupin domain-containing protein [Mariprofundus micogutta]GAV19161.1 cupin domain protein [Mariprofundus micogutta]
MKLVNLSEIKPEGLSHDADIMKRVLLGESELPGSVRLSHAVFKPGQKASAHKHTDLYEVFYLLGGTGVITVDGVSQPLEKGSCIRIDSNEEHELVNNGDEEMTVLYFGLKGE